MLTSTTCTRLVCDTCGAELSDPDEQYGPGNSAAWLRYLAVEDGWVLGGDAGDQCEVCSGAADAG